MDYLDVSHSERIDLASEHPLPPKIWGQRNFESNFTILDYLLETCSQE